MRRTTVGLLGWLVALVGWPCASARAQETTEWRVLAERGVVEGHLDDQAPRALVYGDRLPTGLELTVAEDARVRLLEPTARTLVRLRGPCTWVVGAELPEGVEPRTLGVGTVLNAVQAMDRQAAATPGERQALVGLRGPLHTTEGEPRHLILIAPHGTCSGTRDASTLEVRVDWWADAEVGFESFQVTIADAEGNPLTSETLSGALRSCTLQVEAPPRTRLRAQVEGQPAAGDPHVVEGAFHRLPTRGRGVARLREELEELDAILPEEGRGAEALLMHSELHARHGLYAQAASELLQAMRSTPDTAAALRPRLRELLQAMRFDLGTSEAEIEGFLNDLLLGEAR